MLARAIDLFFPPQCLACETIVPAHGTLCLPCWQQVKFITDPHCACCGMPFDYALGDGALCGECLRDKPPFALARSVFVYDDLSRALVLKFKYHDQTQLAPVYAAWLAKAGREMIEASDLIVPVPLHWKRFVGRRYNQAALLSQAVGKITGKPVIPDALKRIRPTDSQTGLSRAQRAENVRGAFAPHPRHAGKLRDKSILLIDDVMTTGITARACARALMKAGAMRVQVLTLARTP